MTKELHQQITVLKLLDKPNDPYRFVLERSPFGDGELDNEDDPASKQTAASSQTPETKVVGRIFPTLPPYNTAAFRIELTLLPIYPMDGPKVCFLTPIYHINVAQKGTRTVIASQIYSHVPRAGEFCHPLLSKVMQWKPTTTLLQVLHAVIDRINHPELEYAGGTRKCRRFSSHVLFHAGSIQS